METNIVNVLVNSLSIVLYGAAIHVELTYRQIVNANCNIRCSVKRLYIVEFFYDCQFVKLQSIKTYVLLLLSYHK